MSLSAAATRARLLDPVTNPRKNVAGGLVVPITLRFNVASNMDVVRQALRYIWGEPYYMRGNAFGIMGAGFVGGAAKSSERMHISPIFLGSGYLDANEIASVPLNPSNTVRNPHFRDNVAGWTTVGAGTTLVRDTSQHNFGPASGFIDTGNNASDGVYYQTTRLTKGATATWRMWGWARIAVGATNVRGYIAEYQSDGTTLIGKTNTTAAALNTTWQLFTTTRAGVLGGSIIRVGIEKVGTVDETFHIGGFGAAPSAQGGDLASSNIIQAGQTLHIDAKLVANAGGLEIDPAIIYDGFDAAFGTVSTDKDDLAYGDYEFLIAA
jgi:hypothetical protein